MAKAVQVQRTGGRRRQWQAVVRRFERSGLSVVRFCVAGSISAWSLYDWRRKLGRGARVRQAAGVDGGGFVDVGSVRAPKFEAAIATVPSVEVPGGMQLRIDLGGGLVLQILRCWCSSPKARCGCSSTASQSTCDCRRRK